MIVIALVKLRNAFKQLENVRDVQQVRDMIHQLNNVVYVPQEHIPQEIKVLVKIVQLVNIRLQMEHQHVHLVRREHIKINLVKQVVYHVQEESGQHQGYLHALLVNTDAMEIVSKQMENVLHVLQDMELIQIQENV